MNKRKDGHSAMTEEETQAEIRRLKERCEYLERECALLLAEHGLITLTDTELKEEISKRRNSRKKKIARSKLSGKASALKASKEDECFKGRPSGDKRQTIRHQTADRKSV